MRYQKLRYKTSGNFTPDIKFKTQIELSRTVLIKSDRILQLNAVELKYIVRD